MNNKSRHWTFIVYPESVNPNWIDFLIETGLPFAISPLHDKDLNPDGTKKKAHYHVLVNFDGPTTYNNVKVNICDNINATIPKRIMSLRGAFRYLCHLDNPDKYQYKSLDIQLYNNFNIEQTETEIIYQMSQITIFINENKIDNIVDLINGYILSGDLDSFRVVSSRMYYFTKYIDNLKRL